MAEGGQHAKQRRNGSDDSCRRQRHTIEVIDKHDCKTGCLFWWKV